MYNSIVNFNHFNSLILTIVWTLYKNLLYLLEILGIFRLFLKLEDVKAAQNEMQISNL